MPCVSDFEMKMPGSQHFWNWAPVPVSFHLYNTYHSWLSHHSSCYHKPTCRCLQTLSPSSSKSQPILWIFQPNYYHFCILSPPLPVSCYCPNSECHYLSPGLLKDLLTGLPTSIIFSLPKANISQHVVYLKSKAGFQPLCLKGSLAYSGHCSQTGFQHQLLLDSYSMFGQNQKTKTCGVRSFRETFYLLAFVHTILSVWSICFHLCFPTVTHPHSVRFVRP